jgi:hypothetical protein
MSATLRGIYHNLKESEYVASNGEVTFFFSSRLYLTKFLDGYQENRNQFLEKLNKIANTQLNMNTLADVSFYQSIEKRGFRVQLKGVELNWQDTQKYALRKMTVPNTPNWQRIQKPKLGERLKTME